MFSASFSPATLSSSFWGDSQGTPRSAGIYNPSRESWAYPGAFAQLDVPRKPLGAWYPLFRPHPPQDPPPPGNSVLIHSHVVASISGLELQIQALVFCIIHLIKPTIVPCFVLLLIEKIIQGLYFLNF